MEELAALIDGRLPTAEAARVRAHLASCEDCYEVFAETLHLQEELRGEEKPGGAVVSFPFEGRRKVRPWWAAAAAALLVVGVGVGTWWTEHSRKAPDFSVADLAKPLAGKLADPLKIAWSETTRGGEGNKEQATEKLAVQAGVAVLNLQVALDSNNKDAADSAAAQVCNVLGISRGSDGSLKSSQLNFPDSKIVPFYGELRGNLLKGAPRDFAREAAGNAEALRTPLEEVYFDLGKWAEAGRLAAISKELAPSRGKEAAYFLRQLQKDKDADVPDEVVTALKDIEKLPADEYPKLKTAFEKILNHYYPQGRPYEG